MPAHTALRFAHEDIRDHGLGRLDAERRPGPGRKTAKFGDHLGQIYEKEGKRGGTLPFAVMVPELRDASGRLVAEARLTGVETAKPPDEGEAR